MNYVRKIARNNMKQKQGNNEINLAWRSRQIKKNMELKIGANSLINHKT